MLAGGAAGSIVISLVCQRMRGLDILNPVALTDFVRGGGKLFQTIPHDNPSSNSIPFLIGNCYMALGDVHQAEKLFRQAIELNPNAAER